MLDSLFLDTVFLYSFHYFPLYRLQRNRFGDLLARSVTPFILPNILRLVADPLLETSLLRMRWLLLLLLSPPSFIFLTSRRSISMPHHSSPSCWESKYDDTPNTTCTISHLYLHHTTISYRVLAYMYTQPALPPTLHTTIQFTSSTKKVIPCSFPCTLAWSSST